jgi:hypothetical protein
VRRTALNPLPALGGCQTDFGSPSVLQKCHSDQLSGIGRLPSADLEG